MWRLLFSPPELQKTSHNCFLQAALFPCVRTCPLFAGESQVIVAGHVVPLSALMPNHHHAVLSGLEEAVRLVRPPEVILLSEYTFSLFYYIVKHPINVPINMEFRHYFIPTRTDCVSKLHCYDKMISILFCHYQYCSTYMRAVKPPPIPMRRWCFSTHVTGCNSQKEQTVVLLGQQTTQA